MKLKTPNQDNVIDGVLQMLAVAAGIGGSGAISNFLPEEYRDMIKTAIAGGGVVISSALAGDKSSLGKAVRTFLVATAAKNGYDVVTGMLQQSYTVKENPSLVDRAYSGAIGIGLACPCDENPWGMRAAEVRRISEFPTQIQEVTDNQRALDTSNVANAIV